MKQRTKTAVARDIDVAQRAAQYDQYAKSILSNKNILAWIVKYSIKEFKDNTIEEIISCIEGEPEVAKVPVFPDETSGGNEYIPEKIIGRNTESIIPNEGKVTYDILFSICTVGGAHVKIIVNVESQNNFYPKYSLITRGVFYGARMLSQQLNVEFDDSHYNDIKKVYSIWICTKTPLYAQNTITLFDMNQKNIIGSLPDKGGYDLISVVLVGLGDKENSATPMHELLNTLMDIDISTQEKKNKIEKEFNIPMTKELEEVSHMCNLGEGIYEEGIEQGIEQGREQTIFELVFEKDYSAERGAQKLNISKEEFEEKYQNWLEERSIKVN